MWRRKAENERETETGRLKHCSDRAALFAIRQHKFFPLLTHLIALDQTFFKSF